MANWQPKRFLQAVIAIQLAILGLVGLAALGFDVPVLRQFLGFIYLAFVPGLLILRIFKLHKLGTTDTILYSVGLSITFVMFLGLFMNMLYPLVGFSRPISVLPLIITLTTIVIILCAVAYIQESRAGLSYSQHRSLPWSEFLSPPVLFLLFLPLLSALGTSLVNSYQNNIPLLILIAFIALVAALVAFNRFVPTRLYPLAVAMIAIAILWHWSLISQYLSGWDIHIEYYYQGLVLADSSWNPSLPSNLNTTLSITMLAPIYSLLLNMDTIWIFKIVYPLFFSLVPLALFQVFRKETDDRIAFFAVFFFMSFHVFFGMTDVARQQIAELFFALSILLLLDKGMLPIKKSALLIIFAFSIVVSHYGLYCFYLFYIILAFLFISIVRSNTLVNLWTGLSTHFGKGRSSADITKSLPISMRKSPAMNSLSPIFVVLLVVFGFGWYMYIAYSSVFISFVRIGDYLYHSLVEFYNPEARDPAILLALGMASPAIASVQRHIFLGIQYTTQAFIIIGIIGMLFNMQKTRFRQIYIAMTIASGILLLLCILVPYFAHQFNMTRIYHVTLFFLAPFCVLGGITVFRWLFRVVPSRLFRASANPVYLNLVVILILIPYLLFNTGFIYAVTGDVVTSMALNPEMDYPRFNEQEVSGRKWLLSSMTAGSMVYADEHGGKLLYEHLPFTEVVTFWGETAKISDNTYIYLRSLNVKQGTVKESYRSRKYVEIEGSTFGKEVLVHQNKIYDNGSAQVYK